MKRRLIGLLVAAPMLLPAAPAFAQTAPPAPSCQFQSGFATIAGLIPNVVGNCVANQRASDPQGDAMQQTSNGLLTWSSNTNVVEFTTGTLTWVNSPYGLVLRDGATSYPWEGTTSLSPASPSIPRARRSIPGLAR